MAYSRFKTVNFGAGKAGLSTVGYQLVNADGSANGSRIAASIVAIGAGVYGAVVSFPDAFSGGIRWDTGETTPLYAFEEINPRGSENVALDFAQAVPTANTGQTVGDALNAARAQGFGKWALSGAQLQLFAADGVTVVRTFTLDNAVSPTTRG